VHVTGFERGITALVCYFCVQQAMRVNNTFSTVKLHSALLCHIMVWTCQDRSILNTLFSRVGSVNVDVRYITLLTVL